MREKGDEKHVPPPLGGKNAGIQFSTTCSDVLNARAAGRDLPRSGAGHDIYYSKISYNTACIPGGNNPWIIEA